MRRVLPFARFLHDHYFRCEVDGLENLPGSGPAIYVGNHCGSTYTIEGMLLARNLLERLGPAHPLYFLMHQTFFPTPKIASWLLSVGCVLADRGVARQVLRSGGQFVVFPGGELDSHKAFRERHKISFHGHAGFIRLALQERVPIVPFVHVGTHETLYVVSSGTRIAKALGLPKRMGLKVFPIVLSFPFGLSIGPWFLAQPLPAKVRMRILAPCRLWEHGWTDPEDSEQVAAALAYFETSLQREMNELSRDRRAFFG